MKPLFVFRLTAFFHIAVVETVRADTMLERGAYLVNAVAACANCHTPRMPPGPPLSGGNMFSVGATTVFAPNITFDAKTGIGAWSDAQVIAAIRQDIRPDGSRIGVPMPQHAFAVISNDDARAIVAYLRSVPSVCHHVPVTPRDTAMHPRAKDSIVSTAAPAVAMSRGEYLANGPAHCVECHAIGAGTPGNGPRVFKGSWGAVAAPGLSPANLGVYSREDFARVLTGFRPDGSKLVGPMPVKAYAGLTSADVAAIAGFLGVGKKP